VHPSIIKTNNLMMESIVSGGKNDGIQGSKKMSGLNNTTIQPISTHLAYGSAGNGSKQPGGQHDKSP
jgi:hypothetical protein